MASAGNRSAQAASVLRQQPVELGGELALGAVAVSRCQSGALPLASVFAAQLFAQLFGAVAFHRPLDQRSQRRPAVAVAAQVVAVMFDQVEGEQHCLELAVASRVVAPHRT